MTAIPEGEGFHQAWTSLSRSDRLRMRRLVRIGRPLEDRREAEVAVAYARFQQSRAWIRLFWLWFVPGVVVAMGIASQIHPVVVGAVLALAAQAVFAHWNLSRAERINAHLLGLPEPPE
jgi:hypothetical protein